MQITDKTILLSHQTKKKNKTKTKEKKKPYLGTSKEVVCWKLYQGMRVMQCCILIPTCDGHLLLVIVIPTCNGCRHTWPSPTNRREWYSVEWWPSVKLKAYGHLPPVVESGAMWSSDTYPWWGHKPARPSHTAPPPLSPAGLASVDHAGASPPAQNTHNITGHMAGHMTG